LLKIKWWDWSNEEVKQAVLLLVSSNMNEFIKKAKQND
jgi:hypothetical protein